MTSGDWTPEAGAAIELCKSWTNKVGAKIPCDVYLLGSAIYESGDQFDPQLSDLDLIVHFQDEADPTARAKRLALLRPLKAWLELQLVPTLHRSNCVEPGISVVPITTIELQANIHKSGSRHFFDKNIYLDLKTELESVGVPTAGTCSIRDDARQAIEYVQKIRNQYLSVSANGTGGIPKFDGPDPLPKPLARVAAQLIPDADVGAWYDTRFGLEYLFEELSRRRSDSEDIANLYRKISVRRGGRGKRQPLSDYDQLLLAEILYDRAAALPVEPIATWEIRFGGVTPGDAERERLLLALRNLVADAEILGVFDGSIIVRLRSSKRSYRTFKRLEQLGVLPAYFDVREIGVASIDEAIEPFAFKPQGAIDRIAERIAFWRPLSTDKMAVAEAKLASWLADWLIQDSSLAHASVFTDVSIGTSERQLRADILIQFAELDQNQRVVIEVVRLRNRKSFFEQVDRIHRITLPTIFVVVGRHDQLAGLQEDIRRLSIAQGTMRVVPITLDDD